MSKLRYSQFPALILILILFISGCATKTITEKEYRYVSIPENLLTECLIAQKPEEVRVIDLIKINKYNENSLKDCNNKINAISNINTEFKNSEEK